MTAVQGRRTIWREMWRGRRPWRWLERSLSLAVARYAAGVMFVLLFLGLTPRSTPCHLGGCPQIDPPADVLATLLWIAVTAIAVLALAALTDVLRHAAGWRSRVRAARASMIAPHQWRFPI